MQIAKMLFPFDLLLCFYSFVARTVFDNLQLHPINTHLSSTAASTFYHDLGLKIVKPINNLDLGHAFLGAIVLYVKF